MKTKGLYPAMHTINWFPINPLGANYSPIPLKLRNITVAWTLGYTERGLAQDNVMVWSKNPSYALRLPNIKELSYNKYLEFRTNINLNSCKITLLFFFFMKKAMSYHTISTNSWMSYNYTYKMVIDKNQEKTKKKRAAITTEQCFETPVGHL